MDRRPVGTNTFLVPNWSSLAKYGYSEAANTRLPMLLMGAVRPAKKCASFYFFGELTWTTIGS